ncbi:MFS general substrate transporter [Schizopora paradoxa]|uniref:MFS general substrate transporter n=1 Tax=Schizopora paradoxa TaxID=27342 RepID=A0A0H2R4C4_9AGAM|nr:MFS general substrate transporter [Schizopora paradoxa]
MALDAPESENSKRFRGSIDDEFDACNPVTNGGERREHYDETQPLIAFPANSVTRTPLPWRQLSVLFCLRAVKPLVFELIFPFVNQMILEIGIVDDPERVGFYSGILESIYACMSFISIVPCSLLSERLGRKPVILVTTSGIAISAALFGFSKLYWFMVLTRCIGGGNGGNIAALKTMLAELTDKSNEAVAQTGFAIAYRLGQGIGQPVGGLLSHPERQFSVFDTPFWRRHPFALPGLVSGILAMVLVFVGFYLLDETHPPKKGKAMRRFSSGSSGNSSMTSSREAQVTMSTDVDNNGPQTWISVMKSTPGLHVLMCNRALLYLAVEGMFALYPLFSFTPIQSGGLGSSEADIGIILTFRALLMLLFMFSSTYLLNRWGSLRVYRFSMALLPLTFGLLPVLNFLARSEGAGKNSAAFVLVHFLVITMWALNGLAFPATAVMVNDISPTANSLGIIISMSELVKTFVEAIAPAFVNSTFAFSIKHNIAGGHLTYIIMMSLTTFGFVQPFWLKNRSPAWRNNARADESPD